MGKIELPELQELFSAVSAEVSKWIEENCANCRLYYCCWSHEGCCFNSSNVLACKKHTPLTRAFFRLKTEQGINLAERPFSLERSE